jgi:hypothetical protein
MRFRPDNHTRFFALIVVGVTLAAYALARPDGIVDTAMRVQSSQQALDASPAPAPAATAVPAPSAVSEDDETESLDLPIDGVNDENSGDARVEDIPNSMTMNNDGVLVPAPPPVVSDQSISSEDGLSGAE